MVDDFFLVFSLHVILLFGGGGPAIFRTSVNNGGFSPPFPHPLPTNKKAMAIVGKVGGRRGGGLGLGLGRYAHTH